MMRSDVKSVPGRAALAPVLQWGVAVGLLGVAVIHAAVIGEHLQAWWAAGVFFVVLAAAEAASAAFVVSASRRGSWAAAALSAFTVALWVVTRSSGLPFGPDAGVAQPAGRADLIATALELATLVLLVPLLRARPAPLTLGAFPRGVRLGGIALTVVALGTAEWAVRPAGPSHGIELAASAGLAGAGDPHGAKPAKGLAVRGPQTYDVAIDKPSGPENATFGSFAPPTLKVWPGDTIVFRNGSSHERHTVTFGVRADRANAPRLQTTGLQANPAVFGPCFTDAEATAGTEACPAPPPVPSATGELPAPPYRGRGYWNSGALAPTTAPAGAVKAVAVRLAPTTAPGIYPFVCALHRFMAGQIEVVAPGGERVSPRQLAQLVDGTLMRVGMYVGKTPDPAPPPGTVIAGWGDALLSVDRFAPATISVKAGNTVTWTNTSPFMPHTVSFEPPSADPTAPDALVPAGAGSGSRYSGGVAHSGIISPASPGPANSFSLRFSRPGTYRYTCILHPGMAGTVQVT